MKPPVSKDLRNRILELRRRHSLREVAVLVGVPIGTVKTICSRSGAFRDNPQHRQLFSLPPISASTSTEIMVLELPPQQVVTGDTEIDAVLWLQQVVSTGQPDLIAKATEAKKRIKTPMETLEKRYFQFLAAQHPGDFRITFATIGFGDIESKAKNAISRNVTVKEALARFGNEKAVFSNTPAEDFVVSAPRWPGQTPPPLAGSNSPRAGHADCRAIDGELSHFASGAVSVGEDHSAFASAAMCLVSRLAASFSR